MLEKTKPEKKIVSQNRKAKYDYNIVETIECGMILLGSEVKSLRTGSCNIAEGYITVNKKTGLVELVNISIPAIVSAKYFAHDERRLRILLIHKKEIKKLADYLYKKGHTAIPIEMYFNKAGIVKILIGIAVGKKNVDKRQTIKDRDWKREQARIIKGN